MKIFDQVLVTNDDGYYSEGINALKKILKELSNQVFTVAPLENKSATGRSITLGKKIKYIKLSDFDWIVEGTPTDSMIFALNEIFKNRMPDYIFSGINNGTNVGDEISYSGTVGAAFEGSLRGIRSIAFSQARKKNYKSNFTVIKEFFPKVISKIQEIDFLDDSFFNVNFPNCNSKEVKDILITKSSHQKVSDEVNVNMENSFFEIGRMKVEHVDDIKYDFFAVKNNYISITPITINLTNNNYFDF